MDDEVRFGKFTERASKVLNLAQEEARRLNHNYIGTEHLLLGLVREGESLAAGVLESLGVNLENARTQTMQLLSQVQTTREQSSAGGSSFTFARSAPSIRSLPVQPYKLRHLSTTQPTKAWMSVSIPNGSKGTVLGQVIVGTGGDFTLTLYNGIEDDATIISVIHHPPSGTVLPFHCLVERGLAYTLEGTPGSVTVSYAEPAG